MVLGRSSSTTDGVKKSIALLVIAGSLLTASPVLATSFDITNGQTLTAGQTLANGQTGVVEQGGTLTVSGGTNSITITGSSSINNSGLIDQTGSGRDIRDNQGGLTLTVTNTGTIRAFDGDVIQMNKKDSNVTFYNYGTLTSTNNSAGGSQAIDFNAITTGTNILYNYSTGLIQASEADAVRPGVNGFVYNDGTIKSTTSTGSSSDGIDAQNNSGITIVNATTGSDTVAGTGTIEGARHGITGGPDTGGNGTYTMSITNNLGGTIKGDNGSGINIDGFNAKEVITIVNHGLITGTSSTGDGDGIDVDGVVNLTNSGTIKGLKSTGDVSEGITVGGGTITNNLGGTIEGDNTAGAVGRGITLAGIDKDPVTDDPITPPQGIYVDTTVTNSGLIKGQSDSALAVTGAANAFTITITNNASGTLEGGGSATVVQMGGNDDTIINYGKILADGSGAAIDLGAGTNDLQILGGEAGITGDISGGTGTSSLEIDPGAGNTFSYDGVISNFASVEIDSGTVELFGASTYTGDTTIEGGTVIFGNSQALGISALKMDDGQIETDNLNHLIAIGGNFDQTGGTSFLNLNGAPGDAGNDLITVNGTAKLDGVLTISYQGGLILPFTSRTYTVVETTGGITDAGTGYTDPTLTSSTQGGANGVTITGEVDGDSFKVTLTGKQLPFTPLTTGFTGNQQNVAAYLDRVAPTVTSGPVIPLLQALDIASLDPAALAAALDQLTAVNFASFTSSNAFNNASFTTAQLDSYLANHRGANGTFVSSAGNLDYSGLSVNDPNYLPGLQTVHSRLLAWNPAPGTGLLSDSANLLLSGTDLTAAAAPQLENRWNVFVSGNVILAQDFSDPATGQAHADSTTGAGQIGADYRFTPHLLAGALFAYGHTDADLDAHGSSATVDTYSPGVYASYTDGGWYGNALASYGFASYDQDRNVSIGAFNGTAHSAPDGDQVVANLDGGYDFHSGGWTFGPTLGLQYTHLDVDGYSETGLPGANLTVNSSDADSLRSRLGARAGYAIQCGGLTFTPHLAASWQHEFLEQSRGITSAFSDAGAGSFTVQTANASRDSALVDVGLDAQIDQNWTVFASYTAQAGQDNYFGQSVEAGVKLGF